MNQILVIILCLWINVMRCSSQCPVNKLPANWKAITVPGSDFCYAIGLTRKSQESGKSQCRRTFKGYLARFHDVTTMQAVAKNTRHNTKNIWFDILSKSDGEWTWSDGSTVEQEILNRNQHSAMSNPNACGALTDRRSPKFSYWESEGCQAYHEFLCQAPKLNLVTEGCDGFRLYGNCLIISEQRHNFRNSMTQCSDVFNGKLASLENVEILTAAVNHLELTNKNAEYKIWLDVTWDLGEWRHWTTNLTVNKYEENWSGMTNQRSIANGKTSVVVDQQLDWKWRTWNPEYLAYYVCEVGKNLNSKASESEFKPNEDKDISTTLQKSTTSTMTSLENHDIIIDVRLLGIIGGSAFVVLLVIAMLICLWRHKKCCMKKREPRQISQDPCNANFNFANVSYGNVIERIDSPSQERRDLPEPPEETDMIYATISDSSEATYTAPIPLGNIDNVSILPLPRTTPNSRIDLQDSSNSVDNLTVPPQRPYFSSTTLPMKRNTSTGERISRAMTSPNYAPMKSNQSSKSEPLLQYAELSFETRQSLSQLDNDTYRVADQPTTDDTDHVTNHSEISPSKDYENDRTPFSPGPFSPSFSLRLNPASV